MVQDLLQHTPPEVQMPIATSDPLVQQCKVVNTIDPSGGANGRVVEIAKNNYDLQSYPGIQNKYEETTVYMTTVLPGTWKGYHGHTLRTSNYTLIQGRGEIHVLNIHAKSLKIYEINADEAPYRTITPPGYYIALKNTSDKEIILIGVPNPPYNATVHEQVELPPERVAEAIKQGILAVEIFSCTKNGIIKKDSTSP